MIDSLLWVFILAYLLTAFVVVKRLRGRTPRAVALILFLLPTTPLLYKHALFRIDCQSMAEEQVLDRRSNVDGVLISYNWGMDTQWVYWLVQNGGYTFAEYKTGNEFERNYWDTKLRDTRRMSSPSPAAQYEIKVLKSQPRDFIIKNEFVAVDRMTNQVLGRKVVLFMQAGWISRFLNWKLTNDMDRGGLTCPTIRTTDDLLRFFPTNVLFPAPR